MPTATRTTQHSWISFPMILGLGPFYLGQWMLSLKLLCLTPAKVTWLITGPHLTWRNLTTWSKKAEPPTLSKLPLQDWSDNMHCVSIYRCIHTYIYTSTPHVYIHFTCIHPLHMYTSTPHVFVHLELFTEVLANIPQMIRHLVTYGYLHQWPHHCLSAPLLCVCTCILCKCSLLANKSRL